jgi:hypothetical protein
VGIGPKLIHGSLFKRFTGSEKLQGAVFAEWQRNGALMSLFVIAQSSECSLTPECRHNAHALQKLVNSPYLANYSFNESSSLRQNRFDWWHFQFWPTN